MSQNALAANAPALPADTPSRRTLLTAGAAAALIASTAASLPAADPDAALNVARARWAGCRLAIHAEELRGWDGIPAIAALPNLDVTATPTQLVGVSRDLSRIKAEVQAGGGDAGRPDADDSPAWHAALAEEDRAIDALAETPARTMRGLAFKSELHDMLGWNVRGLADSIMADVAAFAAAHPSLVLPA